jgi:hypothetical protein
MFQDLPPCPTCGDHTLSEVADYVHPDEQDREPAKYWWCLGCDWKSDIFYYPDLQPELGLWEPTKIEISRKDYNFILELITGLAEDLPFNPRVRLAMRKLGQVKIMESEQS